jgi:hemoglobin
VTRPTLFEFAAGEDAFLRLARAHHERCLADPELNHPFSHPDQHPQHVERLAAHWAEVLGGPPGYTESCGDESGLLRLHVCKEDLTELGNRFYDCFVAALDDAQLPADPEFRSAMRAYMRWDARLHALGGGQHPCLHARRGLRSGRRDDAAMSWDGPQNAG